MFIQKSENKILTVLLRMMLGLLSFLMLSQNTAAQETVTVNQENLVEGITVEIQGQILATSGNFLVVSDSSNHTLALRQISLNGTQLWMKKSGEAVEFPNVIHWSEDEESGSLTIDLSGVRAQITPQSILQIIIVPFLFDVPQLKISVYQASDRAGIQTSNLQKIKDVNFEINIEG